jgi:hypothetical protein
MRVASRQPKDPDEGLAQMPCSVCGRPSAGWVVVESTNDQGHQVMEGRSACEVHRLQLVAGTETQAS